MRLPSCSYGFVFVLIAAGAWTRAAGQYATPPTSPDRSGPRETSQVAKSVGDSTAADFPYGVGYAPRWEPASGIHWQKNARLEFYSRPPAPTWRWLTTGRGCCYEQKQKYGVDYPQLQYFGYLPWFYRGDAK